MATPRLVPWATSPSPAKGKTSTIALFPQLDTSEAHGELSARRAMAIPGSIYSLSDSSSDDGYFDPHPKTQPGIPDSVDAFLDVIAAERLTRMPHNGSPWDRVLKHAESFANYASQYQRMLEEVRICLTAKRLPESGDADSRILNRICV